MAKIKIDSAMFYPGYPVFIVLTKAADDEILATTYSSSFTLNDFLVLGVGATGQTAAFLEIGSRLSINFLGGNEGILSDIGGLVSRRTKLQSLIEAGAELAEFEEVPILENGLLTLIGRIEKVVELESSDDPIKLIYVRVEHRLLNEKLAIADDKVDWANFQALEYFGAGKERVYKTVKSDLKTKGAYLKENRRKRL